MAETLRDVMTTDPITLETSASAREAAVAMKDADVGSIPVTEGGTLKGLVTDRDIVVRAVAEGRDPDEVQLGEICSGDVVALSPDDSVSDAVSAMRDSDIRRLPVAENGSVVGIVALGDLAGEHDGGSVLADISAARPNN